jgi:hypothetical protein
MKNVCMMLMAGCMILLWNAVLVNAQNDVTFQVDITDLLEGKEFIPDEDRVELIGSRHPLSATRPIKMERDDEEPTLFKTTVSFPITMENSQLEYQFRVLIDNRYENEDIPRSLRILAEDRTLDALYFNSYAW